MSLNEKRIAWGSSGNANQAQFDTEIASDLWMMGGFGNVGAAITDEGIVIMDCSSMMHGPEIVKRIRAKTDKPFHTIIYTHGHLDHVGGVGAFIKDAEDRGDPRPRIIAHELLVDRFKKYQELGKHQFYMNHVQYGVSIDQGGRFEIPNRPFLDPSIPFPDIIYSRDMKFKLGHLSFELHHSKGESDANTWIYILERKTVIAGDAVKGGMPNIGNPFKAIIRYEVEWAEAMEAIAGLNPEYLIPGHGPVLNAGQIQGVCLGQARFLRYVHDEVVKLMNQGCWLNEVLERVKVPEEWLEKPYLTQAYGCVEFVIRGVYMRYAGWYNGNPSELFPAKRTAIAAEVVDVSGADKLLEKIRKLYQEGNYQLGLNLMDFLVEGTNDKEVLKEALALQAEMFMARAEADKNGMAKNLYLRTAANARIKAESL